MRNNVIYITRALLFIITAMVMVGIGASPFETVSVAMAPTFGDLVFEDGQDNQAGTQLLGYYALDSWIEQKPAYADSVSTMEDLGQVVGSFGMKDGKTFLPLYASPTTGKIDDNAIEGSDQNGYESIYEFFFPKVGPLSIGFSRQAGTSKFVVAVLDNNGQKRILGIKKGLPATLGSVAATTDVASGGGNGTTFQFRSFQNGPAPVFTGSIPLAGSESA